MRGRLTKWGKDHYTTKSGQGTLCQKRIEGELLPAGKRGLCVQCKKVLLHPDSHGHRVRIFGEAGARMLEAQGKLSPEMFGESDV